MDKSELIEIILAEVKLSCEENNIEFVNVNDKTEIFGPNSIIDSILLVGIIIRLEESVLEKTGKEIQVIDEESIISDNESPFRTIETLALHTLAKANAK